MNTKLFTPYRLDEDDKNRIKEAWLKAHKAYLDGNKNVRVRVMLNDENSTTVEVDDFSFRYGRWNYQWEYMNFDELMSLHRWAVSIINSES